MKTTEDSEILWGDASGSDRVDSLYAFFVEAQKMSPPRFKSPSLATLRELVRIGALTEAEYAALDIAAHSS